ncbi:MAG: pseudouridine synthase [Pseudomonadota bacterium]
MAADQTSRGEDWEDEEVSSDDPAAPLPSYVEFTVTEALAGERLDKALAQLAAADAAAEGAAGLGHAAPALSRSRIAEALSEGRVIDPSGKPAPPRGAKAEDGACWRITLPPPVAARPEAEAIPLTILHEDPHLLVVDKPVGMVVHPAPGAERGTLVNALLHHCGESLAGIGGERRPGIVHRIDKETSGLLVVAKSEAALTGLGALFAAHDIERLYRAVLWGAPDPGDPRVMGLPAVTRGELLGSGALRVAAPIARHPTDRKRMAVGARGRHAVTEFATIERYGPSASPWASLVECRLETGRTHQIRVHASHIGHPLVGDATYGAGRRRAPREAGSAGEALGQFPRQALHAARLGFKHPITGEALSFESALPQDLERLITELRRS